MKSILCAVVALGFASSAVADEINVPAGGDIQAAINGASNGDIIQLEATQQAKHQSVMRMLRNKKCATLTQMTIRPIK